MIISKSSLLALTCPCNLNGVLDGTMCSRLFHWQMLHHDLATVKLSEVFSEQMFNDLPFHTRDCQFFIWLDHCLRLPEPSDDMCDHVLHVRHVAFLLGEDFQRRLHCNCRESPIWTWYLTRSCTWNPSQSLARVCSLCRLHVACVRGCVSWLARKSGSSFCGASGSHGVCCTLLDSACAPSRALLAHPSPPSPTRCPSNLCLCSSKRSRHRLRPGKPDARCCAFDPRLFVTQRSRKQGKTRLAAARM